MTTMAEAIQAERPWLLLPRLPCGFCHLRPAAVQGLCSPCAEDEERREQYAAQCAREDVES